MPVQQQMSSFAKKLGGRVAEANAEHQDKPIDLGNRRLPAGIKNGIAKLSAMYTKEQTEDTGMVPKGQTFFRASAVVMAPREHHGSNGVEKIEGQVTSQIIALCDVPAKGQRKATPFSDNWFDFQNLFKLLGIFPPDGREGRPDYSPRAVPDRLLASQMIETYYFAAMKTLTDPTRGPVYISFSTRGWTPPKTPQQPNPSEMVFETWHGLADLAAATNGASFDPAAGVADNTANPAHVDTAAVQPPSHEPPPGRHGARPPTPAVAPTVSPTPTPDDLADEVSALVDIALSDPESATEDGAMATARLEELAWGNGWTKEQTANAPGWDAVGDMALNPPDNGPPTTTATGTVPGPTPKVTLGSRWWFAKRAKDGSKFKNNKGEEFPPQEVEVVTVDGGGKTCTVKATKDNRDIIDIRTKHPVIVNWDWLEMPPY